MPTKPRAQDQLTTERRRAFVIYYCQLGNGSAAARKAGFDYDRAGVTASELLSKPEIQAAIEERREELAERYRITPDRILAEYAKIAFANVLDYTRVDGSGTDLFCDFTGADPDHFAAVAEVTTRTTTKKVDDEPEVTRETRIKLHDKKGALDSIAKITGLMTDGVRLLGPKDGEKPARMEVEIRIIDPPSSLDPEAEA